MNRHQMKHLCGTYCTPNNYRIAVGLCDTTEGLRLMVRTFRSPISKPQNNLISEDMILIKQEITTPEKIVVLLQSYPNLTKLNYPNWTLDEALVGIGAEDFSFREWLEN